MLTGAAASGPGEILRVRLAGFVGFLRANGFGLGAGDSVRLLETAARMDIFDQPRLRWSLRALLCGRVEEWRRFDALFDAYFLPPTKTLFTPTNLSLGDKRKGAGAVRDGSVREPGRVDGDGSAGDEDGAAHRGASRAEALASTDFRALAEAQQARELEALLRRFARRIKRLRLRREDRSLRGRRLDLRTTLRRSIATGGAPLELAWKAPRRVRPRLLLLLDVSRSMSLYSFFYLRLARALGQQLTDVHSFIFHTRLTPIGAALADPDPWRSQERLHLLAAGWAGGTRIGECLRAFNQDYAPRLVHARTAVVIVSDGYDTGEPEVLAAALAALRRRARRLVWLNPLLGQPGYAPEGRAMRAALPHLDLFAPGADLGEIERVLPRIIEELR